LIFYLKVDNQESEVENQIIDFLPRQLIARAGRLGIVMGNADIHYTIYLVHSRAATRI